MHIASRDEIKKIAYDTLYEFDNICKEYDIKYSLFAGTLLGAIRHKGMIPWDDDVDVIMWREEYERLIKVSNAYNSKDYEFFFIENDDRYSYPFGKFAYKKSYSKFNNIKDDLHVGIYVDIFVLDYISNYKFLAYLKRTFLNCYISMLTQKLFINFISKNFFFDVLRKKWFDYYNKNINRGTIYKKLKRIIVFFGKKETKYCSKTTWGKAKGDIFISSKMIDLTFQIFGTKELPIFLNYDYILKEEFGNYMILPDEKDRLFHHELVYIYDTIEEKIAAL